MSKKLIIGLILVVIGIIGIWYFFVKEKGGPNPRIEEEDLTLGQAINFSEIGSLAVANSKLTFTYGENTQRDVVFDTLSICSELASASPCTAMKLSELNGKKALLDGNTMGPKEVLARKIRITKDGEVISQKSPEDRFLSWNEAVRLIQNCQIDMATITETLDVFLTLDTHSKIWTVEPAKGETSLTINQSKPTCGDVSLTTE